VLETDSKEIREEVACRAWSRFALVQRRHQRLAEAADSRAQLLVDLVVVQLPAFMNTGLRLVHMSQLRELQATQWRRLRGGGCADDGLHGTQQADRSTAAATEFKNAPHGEAASAGVLLLQSCRTQRLWFPEAGPAGAADPAMWTLARSSCSAAVSAKACKHCAPAPTTTTNAAHTTTTNAAADRSGMVPPHT